MFTRYDGWIFAFVVGLCAVAAVLSWLGGPHLRRAFRRKCGDEIRDTAGGPHLPAVGKCGDAESGQPKFALQRRRILRSTGSFLLLLALCPAFWLAHHYKINLPPL